MSLIILPRRYRSTLDYLRGELADSFSIQTFDSSISTPKLPMILCIRLPTRLSIPTVAANVPVLIISLALLEILF
ncbi:hypothetical protein PGT21_024067 [Puccinia graminis f. sp. tritici]|uniref:Uncharacterized protein n=1 Tax=Puccinia graminis f. sp. tritici TaxID=56615 RepID=A0A5B0NAY4_PUCGR|nr:hypothetical protein PGT21_024067 [Puccinia graminis f. sp. tritici]